MLQGECLSAVKANKKNHIPRGPTGPVKPIAPDEPVLPVAPTAPVKPLMPGSPVHGQTLRNHQTQTPSHSVGRISSSSVKLTHWSLVTTGRTAAV